MRRMKGGRDEKVRTSLDDKKEGMKRNRSGWKEERDG